MPYIERYDIETTLTLKRHQKRKKKQKSQDFGLETCFVKGSKMENVATNAGTENLRSRILL